MAADIAKKSTPALLGRSSGAAAVAFLASAASVLHAQDLGMKAPPQSRPIAIVGATVHPVSGPRLSNAHVAFDKGVITSVGAGSPPPIENLEVIDGTGLHVYPGLISPMTEIGLTEIASLRPPRDFDEVGDVTPEARAAVAINPDSTYIPVTRAAGILTFAAFPSGGLVPGQPSLLSMDGWTWEDMTIEPSLGVILNWPMMRPVTAWWMDRSEQDQWKDIRQQLERIDQVFDAAEAYHRARRVEPTTPVDLRWEAMSIVLPPPAGEQSGKGDEQAARTQRPVFILADDMDQIRASVTWAAARGLRVVVVGGRDAARASDVLKEHRVPVIIEGTHVVPRRADEPYDARYTLPSELEAAGVSWCMASADRTAHERNLAYNAGTAVAFGLSPEAALRSVTLSSAEILGVADRLGSLDAGKQATLIVTTGDPLEVTSNVVRAFIQGRQIDLTSKQTVLRDKYLERYRQTGQLRPR
ncbi:MAG: amidohydrolase family protein [Planctomycetota bacterium]|nr:amidohydrolase family protein [Planctomycetota bacterium]